MPLLQKNSNLNAELLKKTTWQLDKLWVALRQLVVRTRKESVVEQFKLEACNMSQVKQLEQNYNYTVVRQFTLTTILWGGIVGMSVGVLIAAQLVWPALNFDTPWLTYSRLRPLHTNAVIFAFGTSALFATSYYVVQRTCQTRLFGGKLASFTFWGWQAIILSAVISLPMGWTSGKEYAELEWPIDIAIAVVWVSYAIVFFGTMIKRKTSHIYVANWFFGASS